MKKNKTRIEETNTMRDLMGLKLIKEGGAKKGDQSATDLDYEKDKVEEGGSKKGDQSATDLDYEKNVEEGVIGTSDGEAGAPESEPALKKFDNYEDKTTMEEDSEGEETYNYGDDEGHDREEEEHLEDEEKMAPEDRIKEIERHLDALKDDMGYDEDREDRDEEGTHFAEGKTFKIKKDGKVITLTEGDIKKINQKLLK